MLFSAHQRHWDERLHMFLLAHGTYGHDQLFGVPLDKTQWTTDYVVHLVSWLNHIHQYAVKYLKLASDRVKATCDRLANSAGEGEKSVCSVRHGQEDIHLSSSHPGTARTN